jgi:hypothetical protein
MKRVIVGVVVSIGVWVTPAHAIDVGRISVKSALAGVDCRGVLTLDASFVDVFSPVLGADTDRTSCVTPLGVCVSDGQDPSYGVWAYWKEEGCHLSFAGVQVVCHQSTAGSASFWETRNRTCSISRGGTTLGCTEHLGADYYYRPGRSRVQTCSAQTAAPLPPASLVCIDEEQGGYFSSAAGQCTITRGTQSSTYCTDPVLVDLPTDIGLVGYLPRQVRSVAPTLLAVPTAWRPAPPEGCF